MGKLTCGCLNVKIMVKSSDLQPLDVSQLGVEKDHSHEFFSLDIAEVQLNLEGIKVEHRSLLKKHPISDWLVHQCINCEMLTHCVHTSQGNSKVLVNMSLKSDPTIIERLAQTADYSPLYRIVMRHRVDNSSAVHSLGVQSGKYESLQRTLTTIQQQLNKFLLEEEAAMEERIRQFEETQRRAYAELQSKARRDKNTLINLVLAAEQFNLVSGQGMATAVTSPEVISNAPVSEAVANAPVRRSKSPVPSPDANSNPKRVDPTLPKMTGPAARSAARSAALSAPRSQPFFSRSRGSPDAGGVFDFDPAFSDEQDRPFYESEEETEDTDDSSITEESDLHLPYNHPRSKPAGIYSTSVPITVPLWKTASKRSFEMEQHQEKEAPDMKDMAASIKALARSVHVDGTEMFGELPRPRLHAKDMGNV